MCSNVSRRTLLSAVPATALLSGCLEGTDAAEGDPTTVDVECDVDSDEYLPRVERGPSIVAVLLEEDETRPDDFEPDEVVASDHGCFADRPAFETLFERVDDPDRHIPVQNVVGGEERDYLVVQVTDDDVTDEELAEGIAVVERLYELQEDRGDDVWAVSHDGEPLELGTILPD